MAARTWRLWFFVALLVVLHFVLHLAIGFGPAAPDLLLVAVLLGARRLGGAGAAGLGFVLGLIEDALSLVAFGASAVALTVVGYLGARSRDLLEGESFFFIAIYLFLGKWLRDAIQMAVSRGDAPEWNNLLTVAPLTALYTAIAGAVALLIFRATTGER